MVHPFHDTWYIVIDSIRLLTVLLACVVVILTGWSVSRLVGRPRSRMTIPLHIVVTCFAVSAGFTEIGRIGHVLTWRLPVNLIGLFAALVGMYYFGLNSTVTPTIGLFTPMLRRLEQIEAKVDNVERKLNEKL